MSLTITSQAMQVDLAASSSKRSRSNDSLGPHLKTRKVSLQKPEEFANYEAYEAAMAANALTRSPSLGNQLNGRTISIGPGFRPDDAVKRVRFSFKKTASQDGSQKAREREEQPSAPRYMRKLAKPAASIDPSPEEAELRDLIEKVLVQIPYDYKLDSISRAHNHYETLRNFRRGCNFTDMTLKGKFCYRLAQAYFKRFCSFARPEPGKPDKARLLYLAIQSLDIAKKDCRLPANSSFLARINRFKAHLLSLRNEPDDLKTIQELLKEGVSTNAEGRAELFLEMSNNIRDKEARYDFARRADQEEVVSETLRAQIVARLEELTPPVERAPTPTIDF